MTYKPRDSDSLSATSNGDKSGARIPCKIEGNTAFVDMNGDGQISPKERVPLNRDGAYGPIKVKFKGKFKDLWQFWPPAWLPGIVFQYQRPVQIALAF